ncbi:hypothetical protein RhiirA1_467376 [Rhizophagus irregularis]|uniref:Uncharacterized protein n=1 Tax=Rhizophagus irregularis TaxID=588596 RepID=A0A2N0RC70_9GLOM|nr:hypothetical protein RhiirA1_467376 [Rhizophagus irregularis]
MPEEIPYYYIPYDHILTIKISKEFRPKIFENTPKLIEDLIVKWDNEKIYKSFQTHSQAIYTSRLLNFKNLPVSVNLTFNVSECLNVKLSE